MFRIFSVAFLLYASAVFGYVQALFWRMFSESKGDPMPQEPTSGEWSAFAAMMALPGLIALACLWCAYRTWNGWN